MDNFRGTPKFGIADTFDVSMNVDIATGHTTDIFGDTMVGRVGDVGAIGSAYTSDYLYDVGDIVISTEKIPYKYAEDRIISDFKAYIDKTYSEHYKTDQHNIECFDAWIALDDATPTFRNTALKYLWRYGKKNGSNKNDLMKALHYTLMCLYNDHYKDGK